MPQNFQHYISNTAPRTFMAQMTGPTTSHNKPCTLCQTPRPVLIRCQIDASGRWHMVCPGTCWQNVSGGVEDAQGVKGQFPHYRYGGTWKNKHPDGPISAKKPKRVKARQREQKAKRDREADGTRDDGRRWEDDEDDAAN